VYFEGCHRKTASTYRNRRSFQEDSLPAIFNDSGVLQTSEEGKALAWLEYYRKLFADSTGHSRDHLWWEQYRAGVTSDASLDPLAITWKTKNCCRPERPIRHFTKVPPFWNLQMLQMYGFSSSGRLDSFPNFYRD
jgi:hypothetical protein